MFIQIAVVEGRHRHPTGTTETAERGRKRGIETATTTVSEGGVDRGKGKGNDRVRDATGEGTVMMIGVHPGGGTTEVDIESEARKRKKTGTEAKVVVEPHRNTGTISVPYRLVRERLACIPTASHETDRTSGGVAMGAVVASIWKGTRHVFVGSVCVLTCFFIVGGRKGKVRR